MVDNNIDLDIIDSQNFIEQIVFEKILKNDTEANKLVVLCKVRNDP